MERFFAAAAVRIVRFAPALSRAGQDQEIAVTVRDACRDAALRGGLMASMTTGIAECVSLAIAVIQQRPGARSPITSGPGPVRRAGGASRMFRTLRSDIRMAFRALAGAKLTTAIAVATLAAGIGVNTTVFSVLDATLFRPVPFRDAHRLVSLVNFEPNQGFSYFGFSPALLLRWREQTDLFDRFEAYDRGSFVFEAPGGRELIDGASVTPGLFPTLGVTPSAGRHFVEGDGRAGSDRIVVISDRFWRTRLGKRPNVVGSAISLNGETCQIIGVMPPSFQYPTARADIWLPYDAASPPANPIVQPRALEALARLTAGVTYEHANAQAIERGNRLSVAAGIPGKSTAKLEIPAKVWDTRTVRSLAALGAAVGFLMLIVCANLANLSLSRSLARTRDYAVRSALGATRADIIRETLVENAIIGVIGVALGVAVAWALQQVTATMLPDAVIAGSANPIDMDGRAIGFTALAGLIATLLFGVPPAIVASRTNVSDGLRLESRASTGSRGAQRWRSALVMIEVGLSVVLLVGAALMARSLIKLQQEDRGFDSRGLLSMTVALPKSYAAIESRQQFASALSSTLGRMKGVSGVTLGGVPASLGAINVGQLEFGHQPGVTTPQALVPAREVPRGYFEMLRMPLLDGHTFHDGDPDDAAIVSEAFAKKYWSGMSAVGGRFRFASGPNGGPGAPWRTVVGVVGNVRALSDGKDSGFLIYYQDGHAGPVFTTLRASSTISAYQVFVVRSDDPAGFAQLMKKAVHDADPAAVIWKTELVDHLYADAFARPRVVFLMMGTFALFGLLLVAAGLYAALSHLVTHRLREIGIRSALGATRPQIARMVVGQSLVLTVSGLVAGLLTAIPLVRAMRLLLYNVESSDPLSVVVVSVLLLGVALAATWRPARTAARVDPASLLRG